jgi:2,3-bisphosphoglycerate-dependent phosphoglycerate mutase
MAAVLMGLAVAFAPSRLCQSPAQSRATACTMGARTTHNEMLKDGLLSRLSRFLEPPPPGTLLLLRHGENEMQRDGCPFVGWSDPDLSALGEEQMVEAARAITESGYTFDVAYTSMLKRAVHSTWLLIQELGKIHLPVWKTWRLNERCYGALTGQPLEEVQRVHGKETVASWRRSMDAKPPPFPASHPFNPHQDSRYQRWQDRRGTMRSVPIPNGESMGSSIERVLPVWKREILCASP